MAQHNRINSNQVYEIGKYIWENREELQSLSFPEAHEQVANGTSIAISRSSFKKLTDQMHLSFDKASISPVYSGLNRLQRELGIDFTIE